MKWNHNLGAVLLAACVALLIAVPALPGAAAAQGYKSLSTGAGKNNRVPRREYSLKLVFAERQGPFLGGIDVVIYNQNGKKVVDAHSLGPWFLVNLPEGDYRVVGKWKKGRRAAAEVTVTAGRQKSVYLTF